MENKSEFGNKKINPKSNIRNPKSKLFLPEPNLYRRAGKFEMLP
jgi:hypothetical protein